MDHTIYEGNYCSPVLKHVLCLAYIPEAGANSLIEVSVDPSCQFSNETNRTPHSSCYLRCVSAASYLLIDGMKQGSKICVVAVFRILLPLDLQLDSLGSTDEGSAASKTS